jgi:hypothetical protein
MMVLWLSFLFVGIALAGIALAISSLLFRRWKTGKFAFKSGWVVVPFGCGIAPLLAIILLIVVPWACQTIRPASSDFEEAFGVAPGQEIKSLKGKTEPGFDSRYIYLAFDYSDEAWGSILRASGDRPSLPKSDLVDSDVFQGSTPDWWNPASPWVGKNVCKNSRFHSMMNVNGWNDMVFVHCLSDGRIYVLASSID